MWTDWEWILVDDRSTRPEVAEALARLDGDPRIRVLHREVNGGIVAASNDALAAATGDFVALLDHDDVLLPHALDDVAAALAGEDGDEVDYVYTDESHVMADGRVSAHFPKPDWSPERFRSSMYTCHLSVLRRSLVDELGGFRIGFDGSQDHDLMLRATETAEARGRRIVHLPTSTYHWRNVSSSVSRAAHTVGRAIENGRRAVQEQCDRLGIDAEVVHGPEVGCYRVRRRLPAGTRTTVVVASRLEGGAARPYRLALGATIGAIADLPGAQFVVAHPHDAPAELVTLLHDTLPPHWRPLPVPGPWSVLRALDHALLLHPADVLVSVAPGLAPTTPVGEWLPALAALALPPGIGVVGALVSDRHDAVLHAGWDVPEYREYRLLDQRAGTPTTGNDLLIEREVGEVSLAAAAVAAPRWRELRQFAGGLWHDAGRGLSRALGERGARNLWTPHVRFDQHVAIDL